MAEAQGRLHRGHRVNGMWCLSSRSLELSGGQSRGKRTVLSKAGRVGPSPSPRWSPRGLLARQEELRPGQAPQRQVPGEAGRSALLPWAPCSGLWWATLGGQDGRLPSPGLSSCSPRERRVVFARPRSSAHSVHTAVQTLWDFGAGPKAAAGESSPVSPTPQPCC